METSTVCKPILIVEDHFEIRSMLYEFFKSEGYPVLLACHGQEAIELLERDSTPRPGVILTDFSMPVMNGPAFLLELKRKHPKIFADTPIFVMTADADTHVLNLKITGFVRKPFDLNELSNISARYRV
ncbi:MAG: response regulator [Bdellovibrio sp.]|nr:response regulator [Bdellovibrio sp.]